MYHFLLRLSPALEALLKERAARDRRSLTEVIVIALERYLKPKRKP